MRQPMRALTLLAALFATIPAGAEVIAFRGATIHPIVSDPIESGTMVIEDGEIVALGSDVEAPPGATVVDLAGRHIYPAFVHPSSTLGLVEVDSVRGTVDTGEVGEMNAANRAEVAFNADSMILPVTMSGGVLTAHVVVTGGVFMGTSAVMRLDGWNWEDMTIAAPVGMHLDFPDYVGHRSRHGEEPSKEEVEERRDEALATIDETIANARAYHRAKEAAATGVTAPPSVNRDLEALEPVLDGTLPLYIHADEKTQIEGALDWASENGLTNLVLVSGYDTRYVAERLAIDGVPVILTGVNRLPKRAWEPYDIVYSAAAALYEAGVKFAIGDNFDAANARNLPFEAAMAAAFGLPETAALESITLWPAEILGVADRLGSLEAGKEATFIVTDGNPLEILTSIESAWMAGRQIDFSEDKQRGLYQKYSSRPRPE